MVPTTHPRQCPNPLPDHKHTAPKVGAVPQRSGDTSDALRGGKYKGGEGKSQRRESCPTQFLISAQKHLPQGRIHPISPISCPLQVQGFTHREQSAPGTKPAASWSQGTRAGKPWPSLAPTESGSPAPGHTKRQVLGPHDSRSGGGSRATDTKGGSGQSLRACADGGVGTDGDWGRGIRGGGEVAVLAGGARG